MATVTLRAQTEVAQVTTEPKVPDENQEVVAKEGPPTLAVVASQQQTIVATKTSRDETVTPDKSPFFCFGLFARKPKRNVKKIKQNIPIGVTSRIRIRGTIDRDTLECDIRVSVRPFICPAIRLASLHGNLDDGITSEIKVLKIGGSVTVFRQENKLWVKAELEFRSRSIEKSVEVLSLDFLKRKGTKTESSG